MGWESRVALVTGAASGIGAAITAALAREKAVVGALDVDDARLTRAVLEMHEIGLERIHRLVANVAHAGEVEAAVQELHQAAGAPFALFHAAAVYWPQRDGPTMGLDESAWDEVLSVNLKGAFLVTRAVLPSMLAGGDGSVVYFSSMAGIRGDPYAHAYAASKGGLIAFAKAVAATYGPQGVRANVVCPGFIDTPQVAHIMADEAARERIIQSTALRRVGRPQEIAEFAVAIALSGRYATGSVFVVDGGQAVGY